MLVLHLSGTRATTGKVKLKWMKIPTFVLWLSLLRNVIEVSITSALSNAHVIMRVGRAVVMCLVTLINSRWSFLFAYKYKLACLTLTHSRSCLQTLSPKQPQSTHDHDFPLAGVFGVNYYEQSWMWLLDQRTRHMEQSVGVDTTNLQLCVIQTTAELIV